MTAVEVYQEFIPQTSQKDNLTRNQLLHEVARNYVLRGLGEKNFDAIPYTDNVELRAPLRPGGNDNPLTGRENLREQWWAPLPGLLKGVDLIDTYVNQSETAVTVEFRCHIIQPACTLRVMDRFIVNAEGQIVSQENFLDPRDLTHPGSK